MAKIIVRNSRPTDSIFNEGVTHFFIRRGLPKPGGATAGAGAPGDAGGCDDTPAPAPAPLRARRAPARP